METISKETAYRSLLEAVDELMDACNWDDVIAVGGKPMRHALCLVSAAFEQACKSESAVAL